MATLKHGMRIRRGTSRSGVGTRCGATKTLNPRGPGKHERQKRACRELQLGFPTFGAGFDVLCSKPLVTSY